MAWPTSGTSGWEAFGTDVTTAPVTYPLPALVLGYYYDPSRLGGLGLAQTAVVLEFHGSTIVVRRRVSTIEAEFTMRYVWGDALLDQVVVPEIGEPCTLVLEVYDDDRETVLWAVGTSPGHAHPFLEEPDSYAEQEIDVAAGAATVGTITVSIVDKAQTAGDQDSGWLTALLASGGLGNIIGRRCRVKRFISEEQGYYIIADGPAGPPRLHGSYAAFTFDVRDTRDTERKVRIFQGGGGVTPTGPGEPFDPSGVKTLLPDAVYGGYGFDPGTATYLIDPAAPLLGRWSPGFVETPYDHIALVNLESTPGNAEALRVISLAAYQAMEGSSIEEGVQESLGGDDWQRPYRVRFSQLSLLWRAQGSGDPWSEMGSGTLVIDGNETVIGGSASGKRTNLVLANPYPDFTNETGRVVTSIFVGDSRAQGNYPSAWVPTPNQDIELLVVYRGPPSKDLPVYVEGITAGEFARNVYAGLYSARDADGNLASTGIRYDEARLLLMTDVVRIRLFEVVTDARDWLEKNIYAPTGWVPALDDLGQISPVSQVAPVSVLGLPVIYDAIAEPSPDWNAGERIVNVIRFVYQRDYRPNNAANKETADGLADREIVIEYEDPVSVARNGRQVLEVSGEAFRAIGDGSAEPVSGAIEDEVGWRLAALRQLHVQNRYSLGAPAISVAVMREQTIGLRAGTWVLVDLSWLPDYVTNRRGLIAMAQVVALGDLDCKWRRLLMEVVVPLLEPSS